MSKAATNKRWTDGSMQARVRRRYSAERRFRLLGLAAVAVSVMFLAFLLVTMTLRGAGGFTQVEAAVPLDFASSDLFLDPAALRGPAGQDSVAAAGLEGVLSQAATAAYGVDAE